MNDVFSPARRHERFSVVLSVVCRSTDRRLADQVVNLSLGGACVKTPTPLPAGTRHQFAITVPDSKLRASVVDVPDRTSQLTVGPFQDLITVQPQQAPTIRLPVNSAPIGPTAIQLSLTTANGKLLPLEPITLTVESTRYGRAILFLIGAAIGVMILTSGYRGVRRWLHADTHVASEAAGQPGSVGIGTSGARHPTEAPDDLADARRRADDA